MNINSIINLTTGLFLLFLAVGGNFMAETLGCRTQKILTENMFIKQLFIIMMIYFTIDFTTSDDISPLQLFYRTIGVWIYFILFTKLPANITLLVVILLLSMFIVKKYEQYYRILEKEKKISIKTEVEKINKLEKLKQYLFYIVIGLTIIGNILYLIKQMKDHKDFSLSKFYFGVLKCNSMK